MIRKFFILILNVIFFNALAIQVGVCDDIIQKKNETTDNNINSKNIDEPRKYRSVMFSNIEIDSIFKLLPRFKNKNLGFDTSGFDKIEDIQIIDENNISVYLNSIMYISKNHWSIWLNGNKITNLNNGEGEIIVTHISPLKASFIWTMGDSRWKIINANNQIPENKYKIDNNNINLYFSLSPNQTYIPTSNKTIEGRIKIEKPIENDTKDENNNSGKKTNNTDSKINTSDLNKQDSLFF